uniref:CHK domain-containing protein n=1 Tax=Caenorhabditis japonica TaxID=281687 RepID=A0A8R1HQJ7_CAEJA
MSNLIIENVPLTKEWLADLIEKKIGVKPKIGTSGILDNSELGYMSMIRKVRLHFDAEQEEQHENLPKHVVLKVASSSKGGEVLESAGDIKPDAEEAAAVEKFMHNTECDYYSVFSKLNKKPLRIPTIYETAKAGKTTAPIPVIVMEMIENCKVYDLITGFDKVQLFKIVDEIVKLHIYSLTHEEWKAVEPDEAINEINEVFHSMIKQIAESLAKQPGLEAISTFTRNTFEKDIKFLDKFAEDYLTGKRKSVLVHGDMWAPQILWDKNDDISAIIDWQISHRGGPMEDLHHLLSTCTSIENRKTLTKPLLDYYFDQLSTGLEAKGVKNPWSREEIDEEYKHTFIQGAALTIFANGFWSNSPVLQTDGQPDLGKITESFARCRSYVEEAVAEHNMT